MLGTAVAVLASLDYFQEAPWEELFAGAEGRATSNEQENAEAAERPGASRKSSSSAW